MNWYILNTFKKREIIYMNVDHVLSTASPPTQMDGTCPPDGTSGTIGDYRTSQERAVERNTYEQPEWETFRVELSTGSQLKRSLCACHRAF